MNPFSALCFFRFRKSTEKSARLSADMDTICLKEIDGWHRDPFRRQAPPAGEIDTTRPSIIVGIEQDVGDRVDWHDWYPRPLGLIQWTMASTRGHPIMVDVLRRVSENMRVLDVEKDKSGEGTVRKLDSVVEKSGPGPFVSWRLS